MSLRLTQMLQRTRSEGRAAFVPYLMLGDPNPEATLAFADALVRAGADMLELGLPFSDPPADGPVLQRAAERALAAGMSTRGALELLAALRQRCDVPLSLLCYANPVERYGIGRFYADMAAVGVDAVLIADVPIEEAEPYAGAAKSAGVAPILLASALSDAARLQRIGAVGDGYVYATARVGITGEQRGLADDLHATVERIAKGTGLPVVVGFGLSTPAHVAAVARTGADGVIVGSALALRLEATLARVPDDLTQAAADLEQFAATCRAACTTPDRSPSC